MKRARLGTQLMAALGLLVLGAKCGGADHSAETNVSPAGMGSSTLRDTVPVVVFAFSFEAGVAALEPVVIVGQRGTLQSPPAFDDTAGAGFNARWFGRGQRYRLYNRGRPVGHVAAGAPQEPGCGAGLSATAELEDRDTPLTRSGLALSARGAIVRPALGLRRATDAESTVVYVLARRMLRDSLRGNVSYDSVAAAVQALELGGGQRPVLFGTVIAIAQRQAASAFVIAEDSVGTYRTAFVSIGGGSDGSWHYSLLDLLHLDNDGSPELILIGHGDETSGHTFAVVRRTAAGWRLAYSGGGQGDC